MRTEETLARLCEQLQLNCGDTLAAARACGVSLIFVNQWRKDDPDANERLTEAALVGTQGLVSEAIRRAVHGVDKGVYYKGELVDTQKEYSDSLLTTLLKAKVDDFKGSDSSTPQLTVNIANLMPRAANYDEWLAMKDRTLALPTKEGVLTDDVIEAEFTPVVTPFKGLDL